MKSSDDMNNDSFNRNEQQDVEGKRKETALTETRLRSWMSCLGEEIFEQCEYLCSLAVRKKATG